jgi:hypothetical protein
MGSGVVIADPPRGLGSTPPGDHAPANMPTVKGRGLLSVAAGIAVPNVIPAKTGMTTREIRAEP